LGLVLTLNLTQGPRLLMTMLLYSNLSTLETSLLQNKQIAIKYHWFRSHDRTESNPDRWLGIEKIESNQQAGDIFIMILTLGKFTCSVDGNALESFHVALL
jgi:hypothetical protein